LTVPELAIKRPVTTLMTLISIVVLGLVALGRVPLAYFGVCMTMTEESEEKRREAETFLQPVRDLVQPAEEAMFAGAVNYQKLPFVLRFLMKNMIKSPEGDFRDWETIRGWAGGLPARLLQA